MDDLRGIITDLLIGVCLTALLQVGMIVWFDASIPEGLEIPWLTMGALIFTILKLVLSYQGSMRY